MHHDYVQAVKVALESGVEPKTIFAQLKIVLDRRGHSRLLSRIVRTLDRELTRANMANVPMLTVARESDAQSVLAKQLIRELMSEDIKPRIVIDETIVGGAKFRANSQEIDASYKTALITLYQTITK